MSRQFYLNSVEVSREKARDELVRAYGERRAEEVLAQLEAGDLGCASTLSGYITIK